MSDRRLADLHRVAGALLDAELARLRAQGARAEALRGEITALDGAVARQHAVIADAFDAPLAGPVLDRWGSWADRRRAVLNTALARELAALEIRRRAAAEAFGRAEALRLILRKAEAGARRKTRRMGRGA